MLKLLRTTMVCVSLFFLSEGRAESGSQAELTGQQGTGWFQDFGVGFSTAGMFQETALGKDYNLAPVLGPSLLIAVYRLPFHRFGLNIGYWYYFDQKTSGTKQVSVTASHQRVDLTVQYDLCWKLLVAGIRMGTGISIATTTTRIKESFNDVSGNHYYLDGTEKTATGSHPGFLVGISAGLNLGRLFSKKSPMDLDLRLQADYFRHSERDDLSVGFLLVVWPMSLVRTFRQ